MNCAHRRRHAVTWWLLAPLALLALIWIALTIFGGDVAPPPGGPA